MNTSELTRPTHATPAHGTPAHAAPARPVVPRPTTGRLRLRPTLRGRGFVVGIVDAAGPDTNGFAPRDRVAWRDTVPELEIGDLYLMDQDDVLGVPSWVTDQQVVSYLGAGLIARALVRTRPFGRGDEIRVVSTDSLVQEMTAAWAKSLGARVVDKGGVFAIHDEPKVRRTVLGSHGKLAQAAVEVFQAIRAGVFDGVRSIPAENQRIAA
jgi:NADPH2:quinone reductase